MKNNKPKQVAQLYGTEREPNPQAGRIYSIEGIAPCLDTCQGGQRMPKIMVKNATKNGGIEIKPGGVIDDGNISPTLETNCKVGVVSVKACLTPDRAEKRQNGRRFKEEGEEMFALTAQDKHGVLIHDGHEVRIRRLTPKECFRLQGFPDEYFERAAAVNSDTQLYKQAGNSVTVNVIYEIAKRLKGEEDEIS